MMPGNPAVADYDDPIYAPFYEAAVDSACRCPSTS